MELIATMGWSAHIKQSNIWKGFGIIWPALHENLKWCFGDGKKFFIGSNHMLGFGSYLSIEGELLIALNQGGLFYINQIIVGWDKGDYDLDDIQGNRNKCKVGTGMDKYNDSLQTFGSV